MTELTPTEKQHIDNKLHYLQIITKRAAYTLPLVDLEKYRDQLKPTPWGNPCLQVINEECSILSIMWETVLEINVSHFLVTDSVAGYRLETIYKAAL
jgi:hypothetical protein